MGTTYIYLLLDPRNNGKGYVGKSDTPKTRFTNGHLRHLRPNTPKVNWIKSLLNKKMIPELIILDEVPRSEWSFWEIHYVDLYKSWGFNLTNWAEPGQHSPMNNRHHTQETKDKLSKMFKGSNRKPWLGKIRNKETRDKISLTKTGTKHNYTRSTTNVNIRRPILQFDLNGSFIKEWSCAREACLYYNFGSGDLSSCCKGKRYSSNGYMWYYKNPKNNEPHVSNILQNIELRKEAYINRKLKFKR